MRRQRPTERRSIGLDHANLPTVWFRAWPVDLLRQIGSTDDYNLLPDSEDVGRLMARPPKHEWKVDLPATPDFRQHRTFATILAERNGLYVVVASARGDFAEAGNRRTAVDVVVTDLVLVSRSAKEAGPSIRGRTRLPATKGAPCRRSSSETKAGSARALGSPGRRGGIAEAWTRARWSRAMASQER